jgi:hypothetical protein
MYKNDKCYGYDLNKRRSDGLLRLYSYPERGAESFGTTREGGTDGDSGTEPRDGNTTKTGTATP